MKRLALGVMLLAQPLFAQDVSEAAGAKLRLLDKLSGQTSDIVLADGEAQNFGHLSVRLDACRYYADNPTAEAFAHLTVKETGQDSPVFDGWMVASSPALSAMDHPRYDVWVLRCDVPDLQLPEVAADPSADANSADPNAQDPAATDAAPGQ